MNRLRRVLTGCGIAAGVAAAGAPLGLLWHAVAPTVPVKVTADGAVLGSSQPEQFIAADGWFSLLGLAFGVLAAVLLWVLARRHRGPAHLLAVVVGGCGAGLLAWQVGRHIGLAHYQHLLDTAPEGATFGKPPDLRATTLKLGRLPLVRGDVLTPALGAAITYTLLAGWSRFPTLRRHEEPEVPQWPVEPFASVD